MAHKKNKQDKDPGKTVIVPEPNGIDYVEVRFTGTSSSEIFVWFFREISDELRLELADRTGYSITGGLRIPIANVMYIRDCIHDRCIILGVDTSGDFSIYNLTIDVDPELLDPKANSSTINFKAGCPSPFDCKPVVESSIIPAETNPLIDYMARDYQSYKQVLLDFISSRYPSLAERSEADFSMVLVELFSYIADRLTYFQESAANEAFLDTSRERISVKRHTRFIDYFMHDGRNARTFLQFDVHADGVIPAGTSVRTDKTSKGLIFETESEKSVYPGNNRLRIHTFGNDDYSLPSGTTHIHLKKRGTRLSIGDHLLINRRKTHDCTIDPDSGSCQIIRITNIQHITDASSTTPLLKIIWSTKDALQHEYPVTQKNGTGKIMRDLTMVRGNITRASHGKTVVEWYPMERNENDSKGFPTEEEGEFIIDDRSWFRIRRERLSFTLRSSPLTIVRKPNEDSDQSMSSLQIFVHHPGVESGFPGECWNHRDTLLDSTPFDPHFTVDIDDNGIAHITFGDGKTGKAFPNGGFVEARYRVGNGSEGNVEYDTLRYLDDPTLSTLILSVTNPLPASGGEDPESVDRVKLIAPASTYAVQERAVTEDDYTRMAETHPMVSRARSRFRWTGSWFTVFVTVDPKGMEHIPANLEESILHHLNQYKMTGFDIRIEEPAYISLDIELDIHIKDFYFREDVRKVLYHVLGSGSYRNGTQGFFHPDNFTFGESLYLSRLYHAAEQVEGVDHLSIRKFRRWGQLTDPELDEGVIELAPNEILRLSNDPNFPEHGKLKLNIYGGK